MLSIFEFYVTAPSIAPTSDNTDGTFHVAHRRINHNGERSAISPVITTVDFPATLTPQGYSDSSSLLRDEFLVSDDSGVTWRIIPRIGTQTGAQTISTFDNSWATTTLLDNQSTTLSTLSLGNFGVGQSPSREFYLVLTNSPLESLRDLTLSITDSSSGDIAKEYSGRILLELLGTASTVSGNGGLTTTSATSVIWEQAGKFTNVIPVTLPNSTYVKMRLNLINFPVGGVSSSLLDLNIELIPNQSSYPTPTFETWQTGSLWLNDYQGFKLPLLSEDSGILTVARLAINVGGFIFVNAFGKTFDLTGLADGSYRLNLSFTGILTIQPAVDPLPDRTYEVATFGIIGESVDVNLEVLRLPLRNESLINLEAGGAVGFGKFVAVSGGKTVIEAIATDTPLGISTSSTTASGESLSLVTRGLALVVAGGNITAGDRLTTDANGEAIVATTDYYAITLEDGVASDLIMVNLV